MYRVPRELVAEHRVLRARARRPHEIARVDVLQRDRDPLLGEVRLERALQMAPDVLTVRAGPGAGTAAATAACTFSIALRHNATRIALSRGRNDPTPLFVITLY